MQLAFTTIFKRSLPVLFSYLFLGFNFGVLFLSKGGSALESFFISVFTFAGAAQYIGLEYYGKIELYFILFSTILFINLRHVLYVSTILSNLSGSWLKKSYIISAMTDENYGMLEMYKNESLSSNDIIKIFLTNQFYWVLGCTLGATINIKTLNIKGLDFCLTAMFIIILISKIKAYKRTPIDG